MYRGPREDIQWNVDPMKMVNIGANYSILKGKGNINLRVNDIFNDMRFKFNSERPFVQNGRFKWESRTAYIGFNYRFGGGKTKLVPENNVIIMKSKEAEASCSITFLYYLKTKLNTSFLF